jgi:formylglycine-generating enzyme required for sulfatase activity
MRAHPEIFKPTSRSTTITLSQIVEHRRRERIETGPAGMVWIEGGTFTMGSDCHYPEEGPAHLVAVEGFVIDRFPVTNSEFARFVEDTGYVTLAERAPDPANYPGAKPEMLAPSSVVFHKPQNRVDLRNHFNWWDYVPGANWRHPLGPRTSLNGKATHPVVHIAFEDAEAFAHWAGKELPTEAEWEFAARGGLEGAAFAWGEELMPDGRLMANTWQGEFPWQNLQCNGYEGTSPVGLFPPNGYGLFDMIGNVWEWTSDWYEARHHVADSCCESIHNPRGGEREASLDPCQPDVPIPRRVMKGGSYLCAPNYCRRYRPAARMAQPIDTSTCHLGFRCVVRKPRH